MLAWAAYLASSWTWCIGMFLPVLLVRDYGPWAFPVFAAPNVVGAAAMGWVLRRPGSSEALVAAHGGAMRLFSVVTILFQIFFAAAAIGASAEFAPLGLPAAALFVIIAIASVTTTGPAMGVIATIASAGLAIAFLTIRPVPFLDTGEAGVATTGARALDLACLAPVICFGFLLCPYLDLTFHRARQALPPRAARAAFGIGFGVLFLGMILFTAAYTGVFFRRIAAILPLALVLAHIIIQTAFTAGIHSHEIAGAAHPRDRARAFSRLILPGCLAGALALAVGIGGLHVGKAPTINPTFETIYRVFMGSYGLLFPAYVLICMLPRRSAPAAAPSRRQILAWLLSAAAAAPLFWLGFVDRQPIWLLPGIAMVFLGWLLSGGRPRRGAAASTEG